MVRASPPPHGEHPQFSGKPETFMKNSSFARLKLRGLASLAAAACFMQSAGLGATTEERFDLLQIGAHTYTNVTVTTKARSYIFLLHAGGMCSIRVSELSPELLERLGYTAVSAKQRRQTNNASVWVGQALAKVNLPQINQVERQMKLKYLDLIANNHSVRLLFAPGVAIALAGIGAFAYLFFCYCSKLICQKAGSRPGGLIWVPVLQLVPMLRAAGMSGWWFWAFCLPVLNLVAQIVFSIKIVEARGKSGWVAVLLVLPVTALFAFLYLAFSSARVSEQAQRPVEIMTLEAA
jgi:hypothetical protein